MMAGQLGGSFRVKGMVERRFGGTWVSESEHHAYIDEVVISKGPIGLLRSVSDD
jgi:hypothetical protein